MAYLKMMPQRSNTHGLVSDQIRGDFITSLTTRDWWEDDGSMKTVLMDSETGHIVEKVRYMGDDFFRYKPRSLEEAKCMFFSPEKQTVTKENGEIVKQWLQWSPQGPMMTEDVVKTVEEVEMERTLQRAEDQKKTRDFAQSVYDILEKYKFHSHHGSVAFTKDDEDGMTVMPWQYIVGGESIIIRLRNISAFLATKREKGVSLKQLRERQDEIHLKLRRDGFEKKMNHHQTESLKEELSEIEETISDLLKHPQKNTKKVANPEVETLTKALKIFKHGGQKAEELCKVMNQIVDENTTHIEFSGNHVGQFYADKAGQSFNVKVLDVNGHAVDLFAMTETKKPVSLRELRSSVISRKMEDVIAQRTANIVNPHIRAKITRDVTQYYKPQIDAALAEERSRRVASASAQTVVEAPARTASAVQATPRSVSAVQAPARTASAVQATPRSVSAVQATPRSVSAVQAPVRTASAVQATPRSVSAVQTPARTVQPQVVSAIQQKPVASASTKKTEKTVQKPTVKSQKNAFSLLETDDA